MKKAFTLIELLIVVAIIAILAAVAVPNFMEAQVRAKVSRVKSDMRSIATAIEAYCVDNIVYPVVDRTVDSQAGTYTTYILKWMGFLAKPKGSLFSSRVCFGLTTPIAYISSLPSDPFDQTDGNVDISNSEAHAKGYSYWYINFDGAARDPIVLATLPTLVSPTPLVFTQSSPQKGVIVNARWLLFSAGPDKKVRTVSAGGTPPGFEAHIMLANLTNYKNSTGGWTANSLMFYDPTNGSTSLGDLWHFSGSSAQR